MIPNQYRATIVTRAGSWRNASLEVCIRFAKEALVILSASERLCKASFHGWPRSRARASYAEHTASCSSAIEREFQQNPLIGIHQSLCDVSRQGRCVKWHHSRRIFSTFSWKGNTIRGVDREQYGESLGLILIIEMELQRYFGRMMRADFHSITCTLTSAVRVHVFLK